MTEWKNPRPINHEAEPEPAPRRVHRVTYKNFSEEFQAAYAEAKQHQEETNSPKIKVYAEKLNRRIVDLNDNMVICLRRNKHRLSLLQLAVKYNSTKWEVAAAVYGRTFTHLNAKYPPWPTPEELEKNSDAWNQRRANHPWRRNTYKTSAKKPG